RPTWWCSGTRTSRSTRPATGCASSTRARRPTAAVSRTARPGCCASNAGDWSRPRSSRSPEQGLPVTPRGRSITVSDGPVARRSDMDRVRQIARAVLYECRPGPDDRNLRGLHPEPYARAHDGLAWRMQTQCLIEAGPADTVDVHVRFLQLVTREVA